MISIPCIPYNTELVNLYLSVHVYASELDTIISPAAIYKPFRYVTLFKLVLGTDTVLDVNPVVVQTSPSLLINIGVAILVELITYFVPE